MFELQCEDLIYLYEHCNGGFPAPYLVYDELITLMNEVHDV